ncbi:KEOPS complex subunit Cgi121 [Halocatena pleomorpha]|uniref:KEOPS complex component n=1 Tax=Halocatena pleomorpha TaxID=1785090 RepID=A0A3P3RCN1_9EURY|nr:KEOPS complex subunit Cgi121 [Halocatena pleomorpha]RRJ31171.1 KEOPS complex component [Halocatena pleomorpha]
MEVVEGIAHIETVAAFVSRLNAIGTEYETTVQAFDARYVVDRAHLRRALSLADRAIEREENIARQRSVETLLYAAGRRQIDQALEIGVGTGATPTVVLIDGGEEHAAANAVYELLDPESTLGNYDESRVRSYFDITDRELAATDVGIPELVRERTVLLTVEK